MQSTFREWTEWFLRSANDVAAPVHVATITWVAVLVCGAVFLRWLIG